MTLANNFLLGAKDLSNRVVSGHVPIRAVLEQSFGATSSFWRGGKPAAALAVHRLGDGGHLDREDDDDIVGLVGCSTKIHAGSWFLSKFPSG